MSGLATRRRIYQKVKAAIDRGVFERPLICSACGYKVPANAEGWASSFIKAHHDDYSKPMNVRWLCESCHKLYHQPHTDMTLGIAAKRTNLMANPQLEDGHTKAKYDSPRKLEKKCLIREYHESHPELSYAEIGQAFGITRGRVSQILKEMHCPVLKGYSANSEERVNGHTK